MKERSIIFQPGGVRAILDDRKSQTRRVVNKLLGFGNVTEFGRSNHHGYDWIFRDKKMLWNDISNERLMECCPYGKVGDRLWVRETFIESGHQDECGALYFKADCPEKPKHLQGRIQQGLLLYPWKPSIHMPRWASRITFEILKVRVERVQDITYAQVIAEGLTWLLTDEQQTDAAHRAGGVEAFGKFWDSINGKKYPWAGNPYVWVIEFKKV